MRDGDGSFVPLTDAVGAVECEILGECVRDCDRLGERVTEGVADGMKIFAAKKYAQRGLCVTYVVVCGDPYV